MRRKTVVGSIETVKNPKLPELRKRVAKAPESPGIYRWMNEEGTILYVGKAKNLRNRLRSYVNPGKGTSLGPWKLSFMQQVTDFDVTVTNSELEALVLETNLIKQLRPKYNVLMKDDKNYVYVRITVQDPYPRIESVRKIMEDGAKYFGPMLSGGELWTTLTMLRAIFPFRTCKMEIEPVQPDATTIPLEVECRHKDRPTPCLDHHIGTCVAPCIGSVTPEQYREQCIDGVMQFLKGDYDGVKLVLKERMAKAAADRKFELAAKMRDHLGKIDRIQNKDQQIVSDTTGEDADILAVAVLSGRADVIVMQRRGGKLIGDRIYSLAGHAEDPQEVLSTFIAQYYADGLDIPETVIVSEELQETDVLEQWLSDLRGRKVKVVLPERGRKSHLLQLAEKNVQEKARLREVKWEADKRNTESSLAQLQELLQLKEPPQRIEGYDISHLGGTETVGSMVVMRGGRSANDHYRSFTIRTLKAGDVDDYAALQEVLRRRLRHLEGQKELEEERWKAKGISFGRARKADQTVFEARPCDPLDGPTPGYKECFVARKGEDVVAYVRMLQHPKGPLELQSLWAEESVRGTEVETALMRHALRSVKKGKVYVVCDGSLEEAHGELGFRYVVKPHPVFQERLQALKEAHPELPERVVLVYEVSQHRVDPSLSARPDLLVIDGGKGQLSAVVSVLKQMELDIPVIGLAKREEEIFVPGQSVPIPFPPDAPAKFLLMRLRDEAHRFANRHRETRLKHVAKGSLLDEVPGIGPKKRSDLLKKFGSIAGIRDASDEALRAVVNDAQLSELRRKLM